MSRVLIVDDALYIRTKLRTLLENNGFTVAGEADNGADAVRRYKELKPDIVSMDIVMPFKTGIKALEEIIQHDPEAVVVMLSALGEEALLIKAMEIGAKSYIEKPLIEEQIVETFKRVEEQYIKR